MRTVLCSNVGVWPERLALLNFEQRGRDSNFYGALGYIASQPTGVDIEGA